MITRKQWNKFVWDVHDAKAKGYEPHIKDLPVMEANRVDHVIYCDAGVVNGERTRVRYDFENAVSPNYRLVWLYYRVTLKRVHLAAVIHREKLDTSRSNS